MLTRSCFVYLLASRPDGTLYIGVTNDLPKRAWQHKEGSVEGLTKKYGIESLVWYEQADSVESAIVREKQIKKCNRAWKVELIEASNPAWNDLHDVIVTQVDSRLRGNDTESTRFSCQSKRNQ
jgi:putative endonuclease